MKLNGSMFRDAMTINHIMIDGKQANFHNSEIKFWNHKSIFAR